jgi:hypothetical protein
VAKTSGIDDYSDWLLVMVVLFGLNTAEDI